MKTKDCNCSDQLTDEEISDIKESLNDIRNGNVRVLSGTLDAKTIIDKIIQWSEGDDV